MTSPWIIDALVDWFLGPRRACGKRHRNPRYHDVTPEGRLVLCPIWEKEMLASVAARLSEGPQT